MLLLAAAPRADAHAVLEQTVPASNAVLQTPPTRVALRFDEPVITSLGSLRVLDGQGERVDTGAVTRPDSHSVAVALEPGLPQGTYTVAWRVLSADTHPVVGAFVFSVGQPGPNSSGLVEQALEQSRTPKAISVAFTAVRFIADAMLLLCVGGTAALALVLGTAPAHVRRRLLAALGCFAGVLTLASLTGVLLQGADAAGLGIGQAARWQIVSAVIETRFGEVWVARAALALGIVALAIFLRRRPRREWALDIALVLCVGLVITPAAAGHASTSGALSFVMDVVHVQAAAIWVGGLAFVALALLWAGGARWQLAAATVPRFSAIAVVAVAVLLGAGIVNAYLQIRSWAGLRDTSYGHLVLVKAGLLVVIIGLGAYQSRRAVPRLKARVTSAIERRRFVQAVGVELTIVVAVLAVTAVLVATPPARSVSTRSGPYATTTALGPLELELRVDPGRAGSNRIDLYLLDRAGRPATVAELKLSAVLASAGIGPLRFRARWLAPGHYAVAAARLPLRGDWQLNVEARRGEFESLTAGPLTVPIRGS